jgi:hypothetical protein
MREPDLIALDQLCRGWGVKLIAVRSYGLVGRLRVRCLDKIAPLVLSVAPTVCSMMAQ